MLDTKVLAMSTTLTLTAAVIDDNLPLPLLLSPGVQRPRLGEGLRADAAVPVAAPVLGVCAAARRAAEPVPALAQQWPSRQHPSSLVPRPPAASAPCLAVIHIGASSPTPVSGPLLASGTAAPPPLQLGSYVYVQLPPFSARRPACGAAPLVAFVVAPAAVSSAAESPTADVDRLSSLSFR